MQTLYYQSPFEYGQIKSLEIEKGFRGYKIIEGRTAWIVVANDVSFIEFGANVQSLFETEADCREYHKEKQRLENFIDLMKASFDYVSELTEREQKAIKNILLAAKERVIQKVNSR